MFHQETFSDNVEIVYRLLCEDEKMFYEKTT